MKSPLSPLLPVHSAVKSACHCLFHSFPCIHFLNTLYLHALVTCFFLVCSISSVVSFILVGGSPPKSRGLELAILLPGGVRSRGNRAASGLPPFHFEAHMELCVETSAPSSPPAFLLLGPFRAYLCVPLSHQNLSSGVLTSCPLGRLLTHLLPSR